MSRGQPRDSLYPIEAIPGLYISNTRSAGNVSLLRHHRISHVFSFLSQDELHSPWPCPEAPNLCKHIESVAASESVVWHLWNVENEPTRDIVHWLAEIVQNVLDVISRPHPGLNRTTDENIHSQWNHTASSIADITKISDLEAEASGLKEPHTGGRVLVHSSRGISRSGAVVIACIMRTHRLHYNQALSLARSSKALIIPNMGFQYQLRIWEECAYDVFMRATTLPDTILGPKVRYMVLQRELSDIAKAGGKYEVTKARYMWLNKVLEANKHGK